MQTKLNFTSPNSCNDNRKYPELRKKIPTTTHFKKIDKIKQNKS